ncbi:caspase-8-like [Girardinichthys multiradiatus]|uniref:caspase-8-like n=1 Tax=Girardinichthys multiradiatus TaxID=208333 RepID=UPI001FACF44D|nr:caspase-8-like [Girardinichthys multiradiatus]XP_047224036.1 caspase-8-like [Girardinichthys multiradiatus]
MSAKETLKRNKTKIQEVLCGDYRFILNKVQEKELITSREYNNLKNINKEDVEGHVVELVDKMMNKGEETCQHFLDLLQTDEVTGTYPDLKNIQLRDIRVVTEPVRVTAPYCGDMVPESKRQKKEELYELKSQPVGLCLIINNEKFIGRDPRRGTNKDADSLAKVFSWLGFRVLMCKDQTRDQMKETLQCFASLPGDVQPQNLSLQEWSGSCFTAPQQILEHGDAFVCCILSHGSLGAVLGIDSQPLVIKDITRYFKATKESPLTGKPKMFLIQACQGTKIQQGVLLKDVEEDSLTSIPEEADVLVALATVEDHAALRHCIEGSWFVQSVCEQLKEHCPRGEDITSILLHVNDQVGQKEGSICLGKIKQAPEVRFTLRKKLVLSPHSP